MPVKFPKRRADGSFSVEVTLRVNSKQPDVLAARVNSWLGEWVQANRFWKFSHHPESSDGVLDFLRDFTGPPSCIARGTDFLDLRLEGSPETNKAWRDWLVIRLLKDLTAAFVEITAVEEIGNRLK
jgi:hypothetical protein